MPEQSHLDEMNAAIRAQRERHAIPQSMVSGASARPPEPSAAQDAKPEIEPARRLLARLLGR